MTTVARWVFDVAAAAVVAESELSLKPKPNEKFGKSVDNV